MIKHDLSESSTRKTIMRAKVYKRRLAPPPSSAELATIVCGGKPVRVAPTMVSRFSSFCAELVAVGYMVDFVGGWRKGTCSFASRHPCGGAIDINQTARNVVTRRLPADINAMARRHGLLHGAEWKHADAGHFERLDRHSLAQIEGGAKPPPVLAWSERPQAIPKPYLQVATAYTEEELFLAEVGVASLTLLAPLQPIVGAVTALVDGAREYLVHTAIVGGTMERLGPDEAIGRLHPVFAVRLAAAVAEARLNHPGLNRVGCFSAYRPPAFGIGGYRNKFDSNHAYGLACDVAGIGRPGSETAKLWHVIAKKHGLHNPYFDGRKFITVARRDRRTGKVRRAAMYWEWNHYQVTPTVKAVAAVPALRRTITKDGPKDPIKMWRVADKLVDAKLEPPRVARGKKRYAVAN